MSTLANVARYHLVDRQQYVLLPAGLTLFSFLVNLTIVAMIPEAGYSGGLLTLYIFLCVSGAFAATKSLPFGLALGLTRRRYFLGTLLLAVGLGAVYSLAIVALQVVERATGGWGQDMHFFRIPWFLDGSLFQTFLTSLVLLVLTFLYGLGLGLLYRRWQVVGMLLSLAAQVILVLAAILIVTGTDSWPRVGEFFATLSVYGLTAVLAAIAAALALGGFATIRRVTV